MALALFQVTAVGIAVLSGGRLAATVIVALQHALRGLRWWGREEAAVAMLRANGGVVLTMGIGLAIAVVTEVVTFPGVVAMIAVTKAAHATLDTGEMAAIVPRVQGIPTNRARAMGSAAIK